MNEQEFINEIDCRFPYTDTDRAIGLIKSACAISANAAFMVVHELVRIPRSVVVPQAQRELLLNRVEAALDHPLKQLVIDIARRRINNLPVSESDASDAMRQIGQFPDQYNALAIAYFSCESSTDDELGAVDSAYKEVEGEWRGRRSS
jgi:hypothetical protein